MLHQWADSRTVPLGTTTNSKAVSATSNKLTTFILPPPWPIYEKKTYSKFERYKTLRIIIRFYLPGADPGSSNGIGYERIALRCWVQRRVLHGDWLIGQSFSHTARRWLVSHILSTILIGQQLVTHVHVFEALQFTYKGCAKTSHNV